VLRKKQTSVWEKNAPRLESKTTGVQNKCPALFAYLQGVSCDCGPFLFSIFVVFF
jgi:hypothetical protein